MEEAPEGTQEAAVPEPEKPGPKDYNKKTQRKWQKIRKMRHPRGLLAASISWVRVGDIAKKSIERKQALACYAKYPQLWAKKKYFEEKSEYFEKADQQIKAQNS